MTVTTARVTLTFDPKDSHVFLDALRELWEQAKEEEDLLFFDVSESSTTPGTFHLIELWARDIDYLSAVQLNKPYYVPYHEKTIPLWKKDRVIELSQRIANWTVLRPDRLEKNE